MKQNLRFRGGYYPKRIQPIYLLLTIFLLTGVGGKGAIAQEAIAVSGKVISAASGAPITGVTIANKRTRIHSVTDRLGDYRIQARPDDALIYSFVGYVTAEEEVNGREQIIIALDSAEHMLEEVEVSTGYQRIRPERFVGSASVLDSAGFHRRTGMGIIDRIQGTVPGYQNRYNTGTQIRGLSTLTHAASQPLIVVDNFPMDDRFRIEDLHPEDIADITVLKDAAAASVWGALAGNGVIVISTKKGRYNQSHRVSGSINGTVSSKPDLFYYPRMATSDIIDVEIALYEKGRFRAELDNTTFRPPVSPVVELLERLANGGATQTEVDGIIDGYRKLDVRTDLERYVLRRASAQQYHVSLQGGTDLLSYSVSGGMTRSVSPNRISDGNRVMTLNSRLGFRLSKNLELETGISINDRKEDNPTSFAGLPLYPYEMLADSHGNALPVSNMYRVAFLDTAGGGRLLDWQYRTLDEMRLASQQVNGRMAILQFGAKYAPNDWLTAGVRYQHQGMRQQESNLNRPEGYTARDLINRFTQFAGDDVIHVVPPGGIMDVENGNAITQNLRGQLDANKAWGGKHAFTGMIAAEFSETKSERGAVRFYGYDAEHETYDPFVDYEARYPIAYQIAGSSARIPQGASYATGALRRRVSLLATVNYAYRGRYILYGSARRDGANVYGVATNNRWKPLWSAGLGWIVSDEPFFDIPAISYLKFRASLGAMGNTIGGSGFTTILYTSRGPDDYTQLRYATVATPPNPDLRWELIRTANIGFDFRLSNGWLSGGAEVFRKVSTDVIAAMPFDPTTGVTNFNVNSASLKGNGFEGNLAVRYRLGPLAGEHAVNFSYVRTMVTELYDSKLRAGDFISGTLNPSVGKLAYGISSYRWAGLDGETGDPMGLLDGVVTKDYRGIANDLIENQVFHGSSIPLAFGNALTSVSWKGLRVSFNVVGSFRYFYRKPTIDYSVLDGRWAGHADYYRRWQKPGDETRTNVPSMIYPSVSQRESFYVHSEINISRGDHLRIQDGRVQYELKAHGRRLPFRSAQVFFYANNLNIYIWRADGSKYDPDIANGISYTGYPPLKTYNLGFNISI